MDFRDPDKPHIKIFAFKMAIKIWMKESYPYVYKVILNVNCNRTSNRYTATSI